MQNEEGQVSQLSMPFLPINMAQVTPHQQQAIVVCCACLVLLLLPRLRKKLLEYGEAALTVALAAILAGLVLCMPFGIIYISFKGIAFLLQSLARFPLVKAIYDKFVRPLLSGG
ncbi:hypothetical protein DUNSADRAFT_7684 [Dunaliella salina]|uniref:Uncharacterized protein n=1 Tax=Dunaliella salina TaxID=3046 RepID=A0ABQ7H685_DUNSA|nr:hypothetical protein DUNSADRAFT_7684 [Dunaliella salina]|eukprot:KAF5842370.1 hypothetical protein DUNSADRAFT_7684 [Dunaliella salina]